MFLKFSFSIDGYCWALLGIAGYCWALLGIAGHCWVLLGIAGSTADQCLEIVSEEIGKWHKLVVDKQTNRLVLRDATVGFSRT